MNNFFIVTNSFKDENYEFTKKICDYLNEHGGCCSYTKPKSSLDCSVDVIPEDVPEGTECIITIGGDGTLIRTCGALAKLIIPFIGINMGHLGFLCELEKDNVLEALDKILNDEFTIENRMMLHGKSSKCKDMRYALNDIVINRNDRISMIEIKVIVNGEYLTTYHCDGIIISTPTGSTGYNMSANGPIVDPTTDLILLTPLNAHSMTAKSLILDRNAVIEIELSKRREDKPENASVTCDGTYRGTLELGDKIKVRRAGKYIKILKLSHTNFLETLRKKME